MHEMCITVAHRCFVSPREKKFVFNNLLGCVDASQCLFETNNFPFILCKESIKH